MNDQQNVKEPGRLSAYTSDRIAELRALGADAVVLLAHSGPPEDVALAVIPPPLTRDLSTMIYACCT
jgi:hypothetical protein